MGSVENPNFLAKIDGEENFKKKRSDGGKEIFEEDCSYASIGEDGAVNDSIAELKKISAIP